MWLTVLLAAIMLLLLSIGVVLVWSSMKSVPKCPPVKSGPVPWIGCAVEFGKAPLEVIRKAQQELGDIFTIHVAGKCMTFVTDPEDFPLFFQNKNVDFQQAVQPYTMGVAGITKDVFFAYHTAIHDTVKSTLVPATMEELCPSLAVRFHSSLTTNEGDGVADLMEFVRAAMFSSVVRELFGEKLMPAAEKDMRELMQKFVKFDEDFEYGAQLPEIFLGEWRRCKYWLLDFFRSCCKAARNEQRKAKSVTAAEGAKKTLFEVLIDALDESSGHRFSLLLLWASQANALPAVFWTLCFIHSDPSLKEAVTKEVLSSCTALGGDNPSDFLKQGPSQEWLRSCPLVKRCVLEAIRLRAPGMIPRKVTQTHTIKGYTIPEGHLLMLSPYWAHRNETNFPDPEKFHPDRWLACDLDKYQFIEGFVGFGGGRYQCPGRWFALMEMHLFVAMVICLFDIELLDMVPQPSPLHIIGNQQPAGPCPIKYRRRF